MRDTQKYTQKYIIRNEMRKYDRYVRHPTKSSARATSIDYEKRTRDAEQDDRNTI